MSDATATQNQNQKWLQDYEQEFSLKIHVSSHKVPKQNTHTGSEIENKAVC